MIVFVCSIPVSSELSAQWHKNQVTGKSSQVEHISCTRTDGYTNWAQQTGGKNIHTHKTYYNHTNLHDNSVLAISKDLTCTNWVTYTHMELNMHTHQYAAPLAPYSCNNWLNLIKLLGCDRSFWPMWIWKGASAFLVPSTKKKLTDWLKSWFAQGKQINDVKKICQISDVWDFSVTINETRKRVLCLLVNHSTSNCGRWTPAEEAETGN